MPLYSIMPDQETFDETDLILFNALGQEAPGTVRYLNPAVLKHPTEIQWLLNIDDRVESVAETDEFIADLISVQIDEFQAQDLGWFPGEDFNPPEPPPVEQDFQSA